MSFVAESIFPHYRLHVNETMLKFFKKYGQPEIIKFILRAEKYEDSITLFSALRQRRRVLKEEEDELQDFLAVKRARLAEVRKELEAIQEQVDAEE